MTSHLTTISPIDNSVYVERPYASSEDINSALESAQTAQKSWKKVPLAERKKLCEQAVDAFVSKKDEVAEKSVGKWGDR